MYTNMNPLARIGKLVQAEKKEISSIYFYAILAGLIQLSLPLGIQSIVGFVLGGALSTSLVLLIILVVIGVLANGLLQTAQMQVIERIQQKLFVRYSFAFARHIPKLDLQKADHYYLPELVNRFFEVPVLQKSLSKILLDFPIAIIQILLGLMLLCFYHPAFIVFGFLLVLLITVIFYVTGSRGFETSLEKSHYKYAVAGWLEELARVIKSFKFSRSESLHLGKTDEKVLGYLTARKNHFSILLFQYRVLIAFKVIITTAMLVVGCLLLLQQQINIGQFVAAEIVIITIINSVEKLMVNLDSVYSVLTSVEKINTLLDKPEETEGQMTMAATAPMKIELQDLSFAYDEKAVLQNLSATIVAGDKVCVTGANGSGKSTLLRLLAGAYPGFSGALLVNDIPLGNYSLASFRSHTGIVLNDQDVFQGTLWENIAMGNEQLNRGYLLQLCNQAGLMPFIASLKNGFDTMLDPTGKRLARNIVQKILLVRALAQQPRLLLLEEPFQNMAADQRRQLTELLLALKETTVIVVTTDEYFRSRCHTKIEL